MKRLTKHTSKRTDPECVTEPRISLAAYPAPTPFDRALQQMSRVERHGSGCSRPAGQTMLRLGRLLHFYVSKGTMHQE